MDFVSQCASRVTEERKRLKLSQEAAATACGISREMWGKYERAKAAMGGDVLFLFSSAGADVRYIITGDRDAPPPLALTPDERVLLDGFRALDKKTRTRVLAFILGGDPPAGGKVIIHGRVGAQVEKVEGGMTIDMGSKK